MKKLCVVETGMTIEMQVGFERLRHCVGQAVEHHDYGALFPLFQWGQADVFNDRGLYHGVYTLEETKQLLAEIKTIKKKLDGVRWPTRDVPFYSQANQVMAPALKLFGPILDRIEEACCKAVRHSSELVVYDVEAA